MMIFRLNFYVQQVNINLARNIMSIIFTNVLENRTEKQFVGKQWKNYKFFLATKSMPSISLLSY